MTNYQDERIPVPTPWRLIRELRLRRPPWWMVLALAVVVIATWIPVALIYEARRTHSRVPRVHFIQDMDKQPKFGPQAAHPWFIDGRAMRLPVEGTIARGHLKHDQHYYLGYITKDGTESGSPVQFATTLPAALPSGDLVARGHERYRIYCSVCHGEAGIGDGPVSLRAIELKEAKWVAPSNLLTQSMRAKTDGQLFQAISDGIRNMPSYKSLIDPRDRWAIVTYVRQLQATMPIAAERPSLQQ